MLAFQDVDSFPDVVAKGAPGHHQHPPAPPHHHRRLREPARVLEPGRAPRREQRGLRLLRQQHGRHARRDRGRPLARHRPLRAGRVRDGFVGHDASRLWLGGDRAFLQAGLCRARRPRSAGGDVRRGVGPVRGLLLRAAPPRGPIRPARGRRTCSSRSGSTTARRPTSPPRSPGARSASRSSRRRRTPCGASRKRGRRRTAPTWSTTWARRRCRRGRRRRRWTTGCMKQCGGDPRAQAQIVAFLKAGGAITDTCGGACSPQ